MVSQCVKIRPPVLDEASRQVTLCPACWSSNAAARPAMPQPTIPTVWQLDAEPQCGNPKLAILSVSTWFFLMFGGHKFEVPVLAGVFSSRARNTISAIIACVLDVLQFRWKKREWQEQRKWPGTNHIDILPPRYLNQEPCRKRSFYPLGIWTNPTIRKRSFYPLGIWTNPGTNHAGNGAFTP